MVVAVAVASSEKDRCAWSERGLQALASGAAQVWPRLHARLVAPAPAATAPARSCRDALCSLTPAALRDCGLLPAP